MKQPKLILARLKVVFGYTVDQGSATYNPRAGSSPGPFKFRLNPARGPTHPSTLFIFRFTNTWFLEIGFIKPPAKQGEKLFFRKSTVPKFLRRPLFVLHQYFRQKMPKTWFQRLGQPAGTCLVWTWPGKRLPTPAVDYDYSVA